MDSTVNCNRSWLLIARACTAPVQLECQLAALQAGLGRALARNHSLKATWAEEMGGEGVKLCGYKQRLAIDLRAGDRRLDCFI